MALVFNPMITRFAEASAFLQERLPFFQKVGAAAYNPGLEKTYALLDALGNPHRQLVSVHIGGTNGKGSCAHMTAAILQSAGYKTGLFTSPHLKSVTERFRVNGVPMPEDVFTAWVNRLIPMLDEIEPTYFEATVAIALGYFRDMKVDVAVVEVGLGGRLDATNIIHPIACMITNIGHDHLDILGPGLDRVASEKAGIIKPGVPVIIGERQPELENIFLRAAGSCHAPIRFAEEVAEITTNDSAGGYIARVNDRTFTVSPDLKGSYQTMNIRSVLALTETVKQAGMAITDQDIQEGIAHTSALTGLKGRWQQLASDPLLVCDTAHNPEGIAWVAKQAVEATRGKLRWVIGLVADKDPGHLISLLPKTARYYYCQAKSPRAMSAVRLAMLAESAGLNGTVVEDVNRAVQQARSESAPEDLILVCGSNYIVAELHDL